MRRAGLGASAVESRAQGSAGDTAKAEKQSHIAKLKDELAAIDSSIQSYKAPSDKCTRDNENKKPGQQKSNKRATELNLIIGIM